jgi:hypothetical protein
VRKNGWGTEGEVIVATVRGSETGSDKSQAVPEDAASGDSPQDSWWNLFFGTP